MARYPILATFADGCAAAGSGAARRLRVSVTRHPTALYHMVVSFSLMPTFVFPAKPNAAPQPLPEAGATLERTLEAVGRRRLILIEAPSSAYRRGMLSLGNSHAHEEETSCDFTPNSTNFIVASTCTHAPCTSVS